MKKAPSKKSKAAPAKSTQAPATRATTKPLAQTRNAVVTKKAHPSLPAEPSYVALELRKK